MAKPKTRAQKLSIDMRMLGDEPEPQVFSNDTKFAQALRWYGYLHSQEDAKVWLLKHVKANYPKETYEAIRSAPTHKTSMTAGVLAHLLDRGATIPDSSLKFIDESIRKNATYSKVDESVEVAPVAKQMNPHIRLQRKIQEQLADLEEKLDAAVFDGAEFNFYTWATALAVTPQLLNKVRERYTPVLQDFIDHPEDHKNKFSKVELKTLNAMLSDIDRLQSNKKTVRRVRKPAALSAEKVVRGLRFKKDDHKLKLVSIAPTDILGAQELWVYNAKYNALGVYVAKDNVTGLRVKGAGIDNFDETKSINKKVRNAEKVISEVMKVRDPNKVLAALETKAFPLTARLGPEWLLLKVKK